MLHDDPAIRKKKHDFMLRVFDAAVLLGVDAVCGFVGRNQKHSMDQNLLDFEAQFVPLLHAAKSRGLTYRVEQCPMAGWTTGDNWHNNIAYTAGIIHDIGRLGLLVAYPKEYERIIRLAAERCLDLLDFEAEQFGMHHAEAGRILADRWGLPEEFRVVAGRHHDPCEGEELDLLRIVHVACRLADVLGYYVTRPLLPRTFNEVLAELPSREVLLSQFLGVLLAPATKLVRVLNEPASAFARLMKAKADAMPKAEAKTEAPKAEAPKAEAPQAKLPPLPS
jgi:hypothetical protein